MWRRFFLAIGISLCLLGGECLIVDQAVIALPNNDDDPFPVAGTSASLRRMEFTPPEWAPWSLLCAGTVVTLYTLTLHRE